MAVTQLVRSTQIKPGNAYRVVTNDSTGVMSDLAALTASRVLVSDANGLPTASSTTTTTLGYLDISSSLSTLLGTKLNLTGGTMSGAIAMATNKITGLGNPTLDDDAANKLYVDSVAQGLNIHAPCHVATTTELAVAAAGTQSTHTLTFTSAQAISIDNHPLSLNDRVLVKNQTTVDGAPRYGTNDNGIYRVSTLGVTIATAAVIYDTVTFTAVTAGSAGNSIALVFNGTTDDLTTIVGAWNSSNPTNQVGFTGQAGSYIPAAGTATLIGGLDAVACVLTRALDFNGVPAGEVATGDFSFIETGTVNGGSGWVVTSGVGTIVVDTDPIVWSQFSSGNAYSAGNGIDITGQVISLAPLADGKIIVGNVSNVATNVSMSGEATIINTGAVTLSNSAVIGKLLTGFTSGAGAVTSSDSLLAAIQHLDGNVGLKVAKAGDTMTGALTINPVSNQLVLGGVSAGTKVTISSTAPLANRVLTIPAATGDRNFLLSGEAQIVSADISASAAIAFSQLAALTSANILVGNVSNVATSVAMSGDATISNTGALALTNASLSTTHFVTRSIPATGNIDGSNRVFTTAVTPITGTEHVFLNGMLQNGGGNDYTMSGDTITFEVGNAPPSGSVLLISYHK